MGSSESDLGVTICSSLMMACLPDQGCISLSQAQGSEVRGHLQRSLVEWDQSWTNTFSLLGTRILLAADGVGDGDEG